MVWEKLCWNWGSSSKDELHKGLGGKQLSLLPLSVTVEKFKEEDFFRYWLKTYNVVCKTSLLWSLTLTWRIFDTLWNWADTTEFYHILLSKRKNKNKKQKTQGIKSVADTPEEIITSGYRGCNGSDATGLSDTCLLHSFIHSTTIEGLQLLSPWRSRLKL